MPKTLELTGLKFGRLTPIKIAYNNNKNRYNHWECLCDCGNIVVVRSSRLKTGNTKSCGCLQSETSRKNGLNNKTHGFSQIKTGTYRSWRQMRGRCNNKNDKGYKNYGGRGIKICDRWNDFENFLEDMGERPIGKSIDRVDVNGDYLKENCKWSTPIEQANNMRNNVYIEYNGKSQTLSMWSRELNIPRPTLQHRINKSNNLI